MHLIDKRLKENFSSYIFQSALAFVSLVAILYFLDVFTKTAIVAGLGASSFIVFAMPKSVTARPRNVVGGHIVGIVAGSISFFILWLFGLNCIVLPKFTEISLYALSVGLAVFFMVITDTKHPPAGATALGFSIVKGGWPYSDAIFVILSMVALSFSRFLLKRWLKDLA
jgi:CBS-domain-containing membrane protein